MADVRRRTSTGCRSSASASSASCARTSATSSATTRRTRRSFAGPRFFVRLAALEMHPLDTNDRRRAAQGASWASGCCNITKCCTEVCPEHIHITDNAIIPLKERVVDRVLRPAPLGLAEADRERRRLEVVRRRRSPMGREQRLVERSRRPTSGPSARSGCRSPGCATAQADAEHAPLGRLAVSNRRERHDDVPHHEEHHRPVRDPGEHRMAPQSCPAIARNEVEQRCDDRDQEMKRDAEQDGRCCRPNRPADRGRRWRSTGGRAAATLPARPGSERPGPSPSPRRSLR